MSASVKILPHQSLFDIAIQKYGTIEAVVSIAVANNISITQILVPGTKIELPSNAATNTDILAFYAQNNITPATAQLSEDIASLVDAEDVDNLEGTPIIPYNPAFDETFG